MKKALLPIAFSLLSVSTLFAQNYNVLASSEDSLIVLDASANVVELIGISETGGESIQGYTGMAQNPTTATIYVVAKGSTGRYLATFDESANTITKIADLTDNISGIAFNTQGVLYGITGDGAATPNFLYTINVFTGLMLPVTDLSGVAGDDGESIGFNSTDNFMYRLAGGTYLYKINLLNNTQTLVTDALANAGISGHALYYNGVDFVSMTNSMCVMTSTGVQTNCNLLDGDYKGILPRTIVGITPVESTTVKVYPNPASSLLNIERIEGSSERFVITDNSGKILKQGTMESLQTSIDVSDLSAGMYFVSVGNGKTKLMIH
ncbi:MAG: T9SS type A sorting domain-containing protein [Crocinitomicaceae bacterium]|nr:T9SS type A sorting domain-containing protein [Crocinitomicaceae bacterium]